MPRDVADHDPGLAVRKLQLDRAADEAEAEAAEEGSEPEEEAESGAEES